MTDGVESKMTLTETLHGIVCQVCNTRLSGQIPAQQHLQSEAHLRKVRLQQCQSEHPLWCKVCSLLCNSPQQYAAHCDSPRHLQMTAQLDIIQRQQVLTAAQIQLRGAVSVTVGECQQRRDVHPPGEGEEEDARRLGAEGVVSEPFCDTWKTVGRFPSVDPPSSPSVMSSAPQVPPDGVHFEHNRGHCYVCGIELTSMQHKTQHVEGRQHKKKVMTFGSGGGVGDGGGLGAIGGGGGVMICSICNVPLSGELNVQQHFSSMKHKTRKLEHDQQAGTSLFQPPSIAPTDTTAAFNGLHGPHSLPAKPTSLPSQSLYQSLDYQTASSGPGEGAVGGGGSSAHHSQPLEWLSRGGICHMCDQHFQSGKTFISHLQSAEHKQREEDVGKPSCQICQVQYSDGESAWRHLNSQQHKESLLHRQHTAPSSTTALADNLSSTPVKVEGSLPQSLTSSQLSHKMSNIAELELAVKNVVLADSYDFMQPRIPQDAVNQQMPGSNLQDQGAMVIPSVLDRLGERPDKRPAVPEYVFDGSRGMCNVCKIAFTSRTHADSHLAGAKHKKAYVRWQSTVQAADVSDPSQVFNILSGVQARATPTMENPVPSSSSDPSKGKQAYNFDGNRGYCFACKIDLTSEAHANQHLVGKRHQTATERWIQEGESCSYPLFCDVCLKPFTGQESAAQHFSSDKHKKKTVISEGVATAKKDSETGALMIVREGQMWYMCETCKCPLNTLEQFRLHINSPRHNTEVEKTKRQDYSNRSSPYDAGDVATRASPDFSDLQHLVTRSTVRTTPGLFLPQHPPVPGSPLAPEPGASAFKGVPGTQASASGYVPRPGPSGTSSAFTAVGGMSANGSHIKVENGFPQAFSLMGRGGAPSPYAGYGAAAQPLAFPSGSGSLQDDPAGSQGPSNLGPSGAGNRFGGESYLSELAKGLSINPMPRGNTNNRGSRSAGQVVRPDGYYEPEDDNVKPLPDSAFTSNYQDPNVENYPVDDTDASLMMSTVRGGLSLSVTDEEKQQASSSSVSTMSDKLTSIHTDPGSLTVLGALKASSDGAADQVQRSTPELSLFKGFRYACFLCKQPMNTKEDYDRHMKGLKHQMKAATVCAPDKSQEKLVKEYRVSSDDECHYCRTKPRKYQVELMKKAMAHDSTVVYLPTGTGKTLTAMMTLSCMLALNQTRPVLFLVDKVLLVLQQARYIINELGNRAFTRPHLTEDNRMEKRALKVAVLCGGLSVRDGTPLWKHDVIVTTAAFCQNLLQDEVVRWANFSLVVFDEAHHCTKKHPYNCLLTDHHLLLPLAHRPKVLGLTASPAGRRTEEETLIMLKDLLRNLGGATIAIIENQEAKDQLDTFSSSARLVPVCVPMTQDEMGFHQKLLSYFIRAYVELMGCSNLQNISSQRLQALMKSKPPVAEEIRQLAQHLMSEPDELSEMVQLAQTARMKTATATNQNKFENLRMHVMTVGMTLLNSEDGIDFVLDDLERLFNPDLNTSFYDLQDMGLPCGEVATFVNSLCDSAKLRTLEEGKEGAEGGASPSSMSIFQELQVTLANPQYMDWSSKDSMALVLVRERKVAHKFKDHLKRTSFVRKQNMRVAVVVGHGAGGSGEGEGMTLRKQDRVLQGIKDHRYDIVVATSVAEEGVDIPECQLVVCLNPPTTVKALVQMRGRARKKDSYFVVLCSSQREKEKLEDLQGQELNMKKAAARLTAEAGYTDQ